MSSHRASGGARALRWLAVNLASCWWSIEVWTTLILEYAIKIWCNSSTDYRETAKSGGYSPDEQWRNVARPFACGGWSGWVHKKREAEAVFTMTKSPSNQRDQITTARVSGIGLHASSLSTCISLSTMHVIIQTFGGIHPLNTTLIPFNGGITMSAC